MNNNSRMYRDNQRDEVIKEKNSSCTKGYTFQIVRGTMDDRPTPRFTMEFQNTGDGKKIPTAFTGKKKSKERTRTRMGPDLTAIQDCRRQWSNVSHVLRENNFQPRIFMLRNWWSQHYNDDFVLGFQDRLIPCASTGLISVNLLQLVNISGDCSHGIGPWPKVNEMYYPVTNAVLSLILKHTKGHPVTSCQHFFGRNVHIDDYIVLVISITESGPTQGSDYTNREARKTPPQIRHQPSWDQAILPYFGSWSVDEVYPVQLSEDPGNCSQASWISLMVIWAFFILPCLIFYQNLPWINFVEYIVWCVLWIIRISNTSFIRELEYMFIPTAEKVNIERNVGPREPISERDEGIVRRMAKGALMMISEPWEESIQFGACLWRRRQ